jgi:hypothetical protein
MRHGTKPARQRQISDIPFFDLGHKPRSRGVVARQRRHGGFSFHRANRKPWHTGREAQEGRATAGAGFQHCLSGFGGDEGGQQHRIQPGTKALARLAQRHAAIQKVIFGEVFR